ncbi:MAG: hypothetical protein F6K00_16290 [Leptolyngbya sp. SIOISBB]|nr:hypothetical protein [Leptolyngbya sp. SIOISBB]
MPYNPQIHRRRSIRLRHYDYTAPGFYFVTICTHQRQHLFGKIHNGGMVLNDAGQAAQAYWQRLAQHFGNIRLDAFVVMPNHVHGIIEIVAWPDLSDADKTDRSLPTSRANNPDRSSPTSLRGKAFCESRLGTSERNNQNALPLRNVSESVKPDTNHPHVTPPRSIGAIVGNYKSVSTRQINRLRRSSAPPFGNAITTIASSAPPENCTTFAPTSRPILKIGTAIASGCRDNKMSVNNLAD